MDNGIAAEVLGPWAAAAFVGALVGMDGEVDFATDDPNNRNGDWDHYE